MKKIKLHTTLALLKQNYACESGYKKLRKSLGDKWPDDKPINLLHILKSNGTQDMLWCIRATVEPYADHWVFLCGMYADFAESVLPIFEARFPNDDRPRKAIEYARTNKGSAAWAAEAAAWAAEAAAWAAWAAGAAAEAAGAAAEAAWAAAEAAAKAAERKKQAAIIRRYLS